MGKIVRPRSKWTSMKYEIPNALGHDTIAIPQTSYYRAMKILYQRIAEY